MVDKLCAIISLEALGHTTKLSLGVGNKAAKMTIDFRFLTQRKGPMIMTKIINNDQIVFITQSTKDCRGPYITMN